MVLNLCCLHAHNYVRNTINVTKTKMTLRIGVLNLCMAVTADGDIYSQVTEPEMAVYVVYGILKLYPTFGASISCKTIFCTHKKQNTQKKRTSMNQIVMITQYEINGNLDY